MFRFVGKILPGQQQDQWAQDGLFTRHHYFNYFPRPTMTVESPECGPSGSQLTKRHAADGDNKFPSLRWTPPPGKNPDEYLLIVEDLDVPISGPRWYGAFYAIPASRTSVEAGDFEKVKKGVLERALVGGFKYTPIGRGSGKVWVGPKPMSGNGPHRYYFQVIAVKGTVDKRELSQFPTKSSFHSMVEGRMLGWGEWVGVYER